VVRGPKLRRNAKTMPRAAPATAPFKDVILIREVYELLYDHFVEQEGAGIGGAMLLGSPGVGVETFSEYLLKRSKFAVRPCSSEKSCADVLHLGLPAGDSHNEEAGYCCSGGAPTVAGWHMC